MPPKKGNAPSRKSEQKAKQKIIEDKTFGLKNKKGKKQQNYIKSVQSQVHGQKSHREQQMLIQEKKEKEAVKKEEMEMKSLFKVVVDKPKVDPSVDPKSILCPYFKHGLCKKGDKCPNSHDPNVASRSEKKNLFYDVRQDETAANWDQQQLEEVIKKKLGNSAGRRTEIICKYFLDAVEKETYGWFWVCPNNGDNCQYRHALPAGYVFKKKNVQVDSGPSISIEELIEEERYKLGDNLTPVNEQTFSEWRKKIVEKKRLELAKAQQKKKDEIASGKITSKVTGKDLFSFDPKLANDDDEDAIGNDSEMYHQNKDEDADIREIQTTDFNKDEKTVPDSKATYASCLNPRNRDQVTMVSAMEVTPTPEDKEMDELEDLDEELLEQELQDLSL